MNHVDVKIDARSRWGQHSTRPGRLAPASEQVLFLGTQVDQTVEPVLSDFGPSPWEERAGHLGR